MTSTYEKGPSGGGVIHENSDDCNGNQQFCLFASFSPVGHQGKFFGNDAKRRKKKAGRRCRLTAANNITLLPLCPSTSLPFPVSTRT